MHPTGSLKHRLARSLFLFSLCATAGSTRTPRSSRRAPGSTAVSEAYFARLLGLPFIAVMPRSTSQEKIDVITFHGGTLPSRRRPVSHLCGVASARRRDRRPLHGPVHLRRACHGLARQQQHRGVDLRADGARAAPDSRPGSWSGPARVAPRRPSAGSCATSSSPRKVCVVDPENSAFFDAYTEHDPEHTTGVGSRIEGIGRPRVEPSFLPTVIDAMMRVPDAASIAAMRWCTQHLGRSVGGSTGTAMWGAVQLIQRMRADGETGSVVTLVLRRRRALRRHLLRRRLAAQGRHRPAPYDVRAGRVPPVIEHISATRYVTPLREGGSLPGIVEADDLGTYVVKFRGAGQGLKVLVAEVVVGELARRLGLRVPELKAITLDPVIAKYEADEEVQDLLTASVGLNLAVDFLPGAFGFDSHCEPDPDDGRDRPVARRLRRQRRPQLAQPQPADVARRPLVHRPRRRAVLPPQLAGRHG